MQRGTHLGDLLHLHGREVTHRRTAVGGARDDAHALQVHESLANGVSLGGEALHQRVLDEAFARLQVAEQNVELERAHDDPGATGRLLRPQVALLAFAVWRIDRMSKR